MVDRDGQRIGTVIELYYDAETDQPGWALLDVSGARGHTSFVPLTEAAEQGDTVQVPYALARVRSAPGMPASGRLWPQDEAALYRYYGLSYTGASLVDPEELEDGEGNSDLSLAGDAVRVGPAARWLLDEDGEPD